MLQRAASTLPSLAMSPAAARTLSSSREAMTTLAPRLSSSSDIAFPIPVPPPGIQQENGDNCLCVSLSLTCHDGNFVSEESWPEH